MELAAEAERSAVQVAAEKEACAGRLEQARQELQAEREALRAEGEYTPLHPRTAHYIPLV